MLRSLIQGRLNRFLFRDFKEFLEHDLWSADLGKERWLARAALIFMRWLVLLVHGIRKDRLLLWASALTFTSILSIVPFLAVAFSVLKGLGFQNTEFIRELLLGVSAGKEEVVDAIITYINQTNVKTLGVLGVAFLFFVVINLLSNIESAFNAVWGVKRNRTVGRKATDYFTVSLVAPVLIVMAISFTATLQNYEIVQRILADSLWSKLYFLVLKLAPFVAVWLALAFIYRFMPNTRTRLLPVFGGAIIAGTVWQIAQGMYVEFQIGAKNYNAIYGSFAQFPIFLIWVYTSWVIVLLGAEMSFIFQFYRSFVKEAVYRDVSHREKQRLALCILLEMTGAFYSGKKPRSMEELAENLALPMILVRDILNLFIESGLVGRLDHSKDDENDRFSLIRPPEQVTLKGVLDNFNWRGREDMDDGRYTSRFPTVLRAFGQLEQAIENSEANKSLKNLWEEHHGIRPEHGKELEASE